MQRPGGNHEVSGPEVTGALPSSLARVAPRVEAEASILGGLEHSQRMLEETSGIEQRTPQSQRRPAH